MIDDPRLIPPLLHDARLTEFAWDCNLRTLHTLLQCLRRNVDGTPIEDPTVELKLGGVSHIRAHYSPADFSVRPSEFDLERRIQIGDLEDWPHGECEASLAVNSLHSEFDLETSCVQETLFGEQEDNESPLRVHICLNPYNYGPKAARDSLFIACDSIEAFAQGVPLDIELWQRQFDAWWQGWQDHWAEKTDEDSADGETAIEDTFIPGRPADPPDLSYQPPSAPPFQIAPTTAPQELLKPIEKFHNSLRQRDWAMLAAAYPFFDETPEERAARLRERLVGDEFGRWLYVRRVDRWWCEGNRACVVVRGIEHTRTDEDPAGTNEETVVTYDLRKYRHTWVIATWSQGWPRFGSAEKLDEPQPWRDGWNLAQ
ncbi:MAG TPA: hypothetical protein VHC22_32335 [Pirellulales bacterium]|nr:hypothetical protein [Pirellulales bacterium]